MILIPVVATPYGPVIPTPMGPRAVVMTPMGPCVPGIGPIIMTPGGPACAVGGPGLGLGTSIGGSGGNKFWDHADTVGGIVGSVADLLSAIQSFQLIYSFSIMTFVIWRLNNKIPAIT